MTYRTMRRPLDKEAALFAPSGTQSNLLALLPTVIEETNIWWVIMPTPFATKAAEPRIRQHFAPTAAHGI